MKEKNKRNKYLKIRVSEKEMEVIKHKFQNSGMYTLSGFVRAMIFEGYIIQMDENEIHAIYQLVGNIANSINQIARYIRRILPKLRNWCIRLYSLCGFYELR